MSIHPFLCAFFHPSHIYQDNLFLSNALQMRPIQISLTNISVAVYIHFISAAFTLKTFQQLKIRKLKMCNLLTGLKPVQVTGHGNTFQSAVFEIFAALAAFELVLQLCNGKYFQDSNPNRLK